MKLPDRFKSPVLLISIVMLIAFVSKTYAGYEIPNVDELINLLLAVGVGLGIINNPTNSKGL